MMKSIAILFLGLSLFFVGCEKEQKETPKETEPKVEIPADAKIYTVACGRCVFADKSVESGCPAWVQIDGKNYPITGEVASAHKTGLCAHEGKAHIVGELKEGKFISTFMHVQDDGHDHGHDGHDH